MLIRPKITLLIVFVVQIIAAPLILLILSVTLIEKDLMEKIQRINEDISFDGNSWKIDKYNTDPELIGNYPLYILANDGFVLDRRAPIDGFLDSSDFTELLNYQEIQTRESITGQRRRILSLPLKNDSGENVGVVTVSYFNPRDEVLDQVDEELRKSLSYIHSIIKVERDTIDTSSLDERNLPYNISFVIVDKYNTILRKTANVNNIARIANVIDPSYVKKQSEEEGLQIIRDETNAKYFLTETKPLTHKGKTLGVIVVGREIGDLLGLLRNFAVIFGVISTALFIILGIFLSKIINNLSRNNSSSPRKISFNSRESALYIDENKIQIAYATNQYYLLKTLFSNPPKRWETDQVLDKFGEFKTRTDSRKVYDTMNNINKKVEGYLKQKLIINQNKTYQLNQNLPIEKSAS